MRLYRSIGIEELETIFNAQCPVLGKYHCSNEIQNTSKMKNAICFFVDEIRWKDASHKFFIVVDISVTKLEFGIGTYFAGKSLKKAQIWTGKCGSITYGLREAYTESYSINDVKELYIFNYFNLSVTKNLSKICKKNGIKFYDGHNATTAETEFIKNGCKFVDDDYKKFDYISEELYLNRDEIVPLSDEDKYKQKILSETKNQVMKIFEKGDDKAIELAEKIQEILRIPQA